MTLIDDFINQYPTNGIIYAWVPAGGVVLLSFFFTIFLIKYFWRKRERDYFSAIVCVLGLWFTLVGAFILPVDVFLISYMKEPNGTFKSWANNDTRQQIETYLTYTYDAFNAIVVIFAFFLLPLAYFTYEEKNEDETSSFIYRVICALRYTTVFILLAVGLILLGAFVPYHQCTKYNSTENLTAYEKLEDIIADLKTNRGEDALTFVINAITSIGMLIVITYTSIGMSSFPWGTIRGWRSLSLEKDAILVKKRSLTEQIKILQDQERAKGELSITDAGRLQLLEEELFLVNRMQHEADNAMNSWWYKCRCFRRLFNIFGGFFSVGFGFLIWVSLLLTHIDKLTNSFGYNGGYLINDLVILNPLNIAMLAAQQIFPVDYAIYFGVLLFLILCTISGVRFAGIWCFCVKLFKLRAHHSDPQAIIMLVGILMYAVLAINMLLFEIIPQYSTFGSQHYLAMNATTGNLEVVPCTLAAPPSECTMTRASSFIIHYTLKAVVFSVFYYWITWVFLIMVIIGFFFFILSSRLSVIEEAIDPDDFDSDISDIEDNRPLV